MPATMACRNGTDVLLHLLNRIRERDAEVASGRTVEDRACMGPRFAGLREGMIEIHLWFDSFLTAVKVQRDHGPQKVIETGILESGYIVKMPLHRLH
jgi:hypothetical protein